MEAASTNEKNQSVEGFRQLYQKRMENSVPLPTVDFTVNVP